MTELTARALDLTGINPEVRNRAIRRSILEVTVGSTVHGTSVDDGYVG